MVGSFGDIIKKRRAALGMTQARLAELVGRSPSTVRAWERDKSVPDDPEVLNTLAAVLGAEFDPFVDELIGADDPGRGPSSNADLETGPADQEPVPTTAPEPAVAPVSASETPTSEPTDEPVSEPVVAPVPVSVSENAASEAAGESSSGFESVDDPVSDPVVEPVPVSVSENAAPEPAVAPVSASETAASEPTDDLVSEPVVESVPVSVSGMTASPGVRVIGTATADEAEIVGGPRPRETPRAMAAPIGGPDAVVASQQPAADEEVPAEEPASGADVPGQAVGDQGAIPPSSERTPVTPPGDAERSADVMETRGLPRTPTDVYGLGAGAPVRPGSSALLRDTDVETYLDDPEELRLYRIRAGLTVAGGIALLILFRWAFTAAVDTLSTMWDLFTGAF